MTYHQLAMQENLQINKKAKAETQKLYEPKIPPSKLKYLNILIYFVFGGLSLIILYVVYLRFYPTYPLTIHKVSVITPIVKSPGHLSYQMDACKNTDRIATVYRRLISNNTGVAFAPTEGLAVRGCRVTTVTIQVPGGLTPGKGYYLYTDIQYQINQIHQEHVYWQAGPFEVIN